MHIVPYRGQNVKISNFWKSKMAAAAILKITKIAISQQRIDRSSRNLARLCKIGLLTVQTVINWNFQNPRLRIAAILKTVKLTVWLILMTFGMLMQNRSPNRSPIRPLKCRILKFEILDVSHGDANHLANVKVSNTWKFKMTASRHFKSHELMF